MIRYVRLVGGLLLILVLIPAAASAQGSNGLPTDPSGDSPSGAVYEIPLDSGRNDAAPRRLPRQRGGRQRTDAPDGTETSIRSENNFGSSSRVPGVDEPRDGTDALTADAGGGQRSGDGTAAGSVPPGGDGTAAGSVPPGVEPSSVAGMTDTGPSHTLVILLLVLLGVVGTGAGLLAARARHSR